MAFASEKFKNTFGSLFKEFAMNLCPAVCDSVRDKLIVKGFGVEDAGVEERTTPSAQSGGHPSFVRRGVSLGMRKLLQINHPALAEARASSWQGGEFCSVTRRDSTRCEGNLAGTSDGGAGVGGSQRGFEEWGCLHIRLAGYEWVPYYLSEPGDKLHGCLRRGIAGHGPVGGEVLDAAGQAGAAEPLLPGQDREIRFRAGGGGRVSAGERLYQMRNAECGMRNREIEPGRQRIPRSHSEIRNPFGSCRCFISRTTRMWGVSGSRKWRRRYRYRTG